MRNLLSILPHVFTPGMPRLFPATGLMRLKGKMPTISIFRGAGGFSLLFGNDRNAIAGNTTVPSPSIDSRRMRESSPVVLAFDVLEAWHTGLFQHALP